jgi:hypothetical protein
MSETTSAPPRRDGVLDAFDWPRQLRADVVEPSPDPRIHGYAAQSDLAPHYRFGEVVLLALTGELPSETVARAFDVVLAFLAPVSINEGPTHAAALARIAGAPARAVLGVGAVTLAQRGHWTIAALAPLLAWLETGDGELPAGAQSQDPEAANAVARLRAALPASLVTPALHRSLSLQGAIVVVLHACGLRRADAIEAVWTLAALPTVFAEAMAVKPLSFREYPMDTPGFRYEGAR